MAQSLLPFQYQSDKNDSGLIGFAGLPLYVELFIQSGLAQFINQTMQTKTRGWTDKEMILSLILLNLAGGDCISDINRLEQDAGFRTLLMYFATYNMPHKEQRAYEKRWRNMKDRGLPSTAAIHRYLRQFHAAEEETKRVEGIAFIPQSNTLLRILMNLNHPLIARIQKHTPSRVATLDQDATLTYTYKRNALYCYKGPKAYQPFNTYWAEHGTILHSEFRDGNVNAGFEQLRILQEALALLPTEIEQVYLRSDSAGYQEEILRYCAEGTSIRFGVIEFAIAARVTAGIKDASNSLASKHWHPILHKESDGTSIETNQEWADIGYVPEWSVKSKARYRYIAIREPLKPSKSKSDETQELPFQTVKLGEITYKLFAIVTNREEDGGELIQWHRKRCGKSEHVHSTQKEGLAGGQLPSNLFGVNAAWWQLMVLSFNLNRLMQVVALPHQFKESKMKALRLHVIQLPGRIIHHARGIFVRVEAACFELYEVIRNRIAKMSSISHSVTDTS